MPGFEGGVELSCDGLDNDCDGFAEEALAEASEILEVPLPAALHSYSCRLGRLHRAVARQDELREPGRAELAEIARFGEIDLMGVPPRHQGLRSLLALPEGSEIPVMPAPALIRLKLSAGRPQDLADVHALLGAGVDLLAVRSYLGAHAPELVPALAQRPGSILPRMGENPLRSSYAHYAPRPAHRRSTTTAWRSA